MNCPACGLRMGERTTPKGVLFFVCTGWPQCRMCGTPELFERFDQLTAPHEPEPVPLGSFVAQLAQIRVYQSRLNAAKTAEERERVRKQAREVVK